MKGISEMIISSRHVRCSRIVLECAKFLHLIVPPKLRLFGSKCHVRVRGFRCPLKVPFKSPLKALLASVTLVMHCFLFSSLMCQQTPRSMHHKGKGNTRNGLMYIAPSSELKVGEPFKWMYLTPSVVRRGVDIFRYIAFMSSNLAQHAICKKKKLQVYYLTHTHLNIPFLIHPINATCFLHTSNLLHQDIDAQHPLSSTQLLCEVFKSQIPKFIIYLLAMTKEVY